MSQFEELLDQLNAEQKEQSTLAKSMPAADAEDDEAIQAAAAEAELEEELEEELDDEQDEGLVETPMTKSMTLDGEEVEVVDAEALIKSMQDLTGRVGKQEETLTKALTGTLALVKQQGEMLKSMNARLNKMSKSGAGRKTVLSVHDKPATGGEEHLAKSEQGMTAGELMAKAHAAFDAGKISGLELTTIDVSLRGNTQIDQGLLAKALS